MSHNKKSNECGDERAKRKAPTEIIYEGRPAKRMRMDQSKDSGNTPSSRHGLPSNFQSARITKDENGMSADDLMNGIFYKGVRYQFNQLGFSRKYNGPEIEKGQYTDSHNEINVEPIIWEPSSQLGGHPAAQTAFSRNEKQDIKSFCYNGVVIEETQSFDSSNEINVEPIIYEPSDTLETFSYEEDETSAYEFSIMENEFDHQVATGDQPNQFQEDDNLLNILETNNALQQRVNLLVRTGWAPYIMILNIVICIVIYILVFKVISIRQTF